MSELRVDHAVYAVADLDAAGKRFSDELGLDSVAGGRHPGWGTANRIVPLGREYVELVAVVDLAEAGAAPFGRAVMQALASGKRLIGWAVATKDIESVANRLELDVTDGSRARPDGSTLRWRLAGLAHSLGAGALPFFIQWDCPPQLHPGAAAARHLVTPTGIAWVEVAASIDLLAAWLDFPGLPVRVTQGAQSLTAVGIATTAGELVLR